MSSTDRSDKPLEILPGLLLPPSAWSFSFSRSSGPGGQNVNKVSTRASLRVSFPALIEAAARFRPLDETLPDRLRTHFDSRMSDAGGAGDAGGGGEILITSDLTRSQERNRAACLDIFRDLCRRSLIKPRKRIKTKPSRSAQRNRVESKRRRGEVKALRRRSGGGGAED